MEEYISMGELRDRWEKENPGSVADTALPLMWTDKVQKETGEFPFGFIWGYAPHSAFGRPIPVTDKAKEFYEKLPDHLKPGKILA